MARVNNEEELGKALENDEMTIIIENPVLGKIVIKIKKAGKVKWAVAIGAIAAAIVAIVLMVPALGTGPAAPPSEAILALSATATGGAAVSILGLAATIAAIKICLKSKSTKVLKKLRENYVIVSNNNGIIKLQRK
jgi:hypothetical protein